MNKRSLTMLALLILALALVLSACSGPAIPHELDGRADCTSCHGTDGVKPFPKFHEKEGFTNDTCLDCHAS